MFGTISKIYSNSKGSVKKRVYIIEDAEDLRDAFSMIISNSGKYQVVGTAGSYESAVVDIRKKFPEIIVVDLGLPGISGVEAIQQIKQKFPFIEIMVMTIHEDHEMVFEAIKAGASGYLLKNYDTSALIQSLDELSAGGAPMSSKIARMVVNEFNATSRNSILEENEIKILEMICFGKTYSMISQELNLSKSIVQKHIRNIYRKLNVSRKSDAVQKGRELKLF